jgi:hypothetical protein
MAASSSQAPAPTRYGKHFGTPSNPIFTTTGKSGFSPFPYQQESFLDTQTLLDNYRIREAYQRNIFRTFTAQELEESGCLSKADAEPSDLLNPIHKIMQKDKWVTGPDSIGGGIIGKWNGKNPVVWKALKPILRLATRLLFTPALFPVTIPSLCHSSSLPFIYTLSGLSDKFHLFPKIHLLTFL